MPAVADDRFARGFWVVLRIGIDPFGVRHDDIELVIFIHFRVDRLTVTTQVPIDTTAAKDRATCGKVDRRFSREDPDVRGPFDEDSVFGQHRVQLGHHLHQTVQEPFAPVEPSFGQIFRYAAGDDIAASQPGAADELEKVENFFSLAERI